MGRIGGNGGFDLVGRHQPVGDTGKRPAFQLFTPDRPAVGAGTAAMMAHAAITVADDDGIGAAALAAFEQARQKIGRTPPPVDAPRQRRFLDALVPLRRTSCWRLAASHRSSVMMRRSGTSFLIHSDSGLSRVTSLPVVGSLTLCLWFQTRTPT